MSKIFSKTTVDAPIIFSGFEEMPSLPDSMATDIQVMRTLMGEGSGVNGSKQMTNAEKRKILGKTFKPSDLKKLFTSELEKLFQEFLINPEDLYNRTVFMNKSVHILGQANKNSGGFQPKGTPQDQFDKQSEKMAEEEAEQEIPEVKADLSDPDLVRHPRLEAILSNIRVGNNVFLVGPAGSGKTTIAMQIAELLGLDFHFTGAVHQKHDVMGYMDINSNLVRTPFREAYENGGLFLFDEYDASVPNAITAFNAALSNGMCAFPDGIVKQHKDFVAIAAGNTYGTGASRQYVGRFQQDAASLDRFVFIEIDYDTNLETTLALSAFYKSGGKKEKDTRVKQLLHKIRGIRKAVGDLGIPHVVSPRASIMGSRLLALDIIEAQEIHEQVIYKGLSSENRKQITQHKG